MNGFESRKLILKPFVREVLMQIVQYNVQLPISRYKIQIAADGPQTFLQKKTQDFEAKNRLNSCFNILIHIWLFSGPRSGENPQMDK